MADPGEFILLKLATEGEGWAGRVQQQIKAWAASGMSEANILDKLASDLAPGGVTFEAMMKAFQNAAGEVVDYLTIEQVHDEWTGPDQWIWISNTDENRCDDCAERHGEVKTWNEWQQWGLPGMGTTVCGWRCRCALEPFDIAFDSGNILKVK